jgi:hypothetical protein
MEQLVTDARFYLKLKQLPITCGSDIENFKIIIAEDLI